MIQKGKVKRIIPLLLVESPTTTRKGKAKYNSVKRKLEKMERENWFKLDKVLGELQMDIEKNLKKLGFE